MHVTQRFSHANQVLRAGRHVVRHPFVARVAVRTRQARGSRRIEELNGQIAIECREVGIHGDLAGRRRGPAEEIHIGRVVDVQVVDGDVTATDHVGRARRVVRFACIRRDERQLEIVFAGEESRELGHAQIDLLTCGHRHRDAFVVVQAGGRSDLRLSQIVHAQV